jgi:PTH2 family peptidyl-tRNA hydrolase
MYTSKQMIVVRRDLKMRKGKIAAQAGHACVEAVLMALAREDRLADVLVGGDTVYLRNTNKEDTPLSLWFRDGVAKICVYVDSEEELLALDRKAKEAGIIAALICDAGHTEFHEVPTYTCLALEPLDIAAADALTGDLPLY